MELVFIWYPKGAICELSKYGGSIFKGTKNYANNRVNTIYINLTELIKKGYNQERLILWVIEPQCVISYPRSLQLHNDHKFYLKY